MGQASSEYLRNSLSAAVVVALGIAVMPATAAAQEAGTEAKSLDAVLVTGSRNSTRTVENSSTPIDLISAEELAVTGKGDLLQALLTKLPSLSLQTYGSGLDNQVRGAMLRNLSPERLAAQLALQPTGRAGQPQDIANAVSFLAAPHMDFITGQVIFVDGGKSLGGSGA